MRLPLLRFGLAATALGLATSACTVGPDYHKPQLPTPTGYIEAQSTARTQVTTSDADLSGWLSPRSLPRLSAQLRLYGFSGLLGLPNLL